MFIELCGTPNYLAPEVLKAGMYEDAEGYSYPVDMFVLLLIALPHLLCHSSLINFHIFFVISSFLSGFLNVMFFRKNPNFESLQNHNVHYFINYFTGGHAVLSCTLCKYDVCYFVKMFKMLLILKFFFCNNDADWSAALHFGIASK